MPPQGPWGGDHPNCLPLEREQVEEGKEKRESK